MQFNVVALTLAAMATLVAAETVTVYECSTSSTLGYASATIAPTATGTYPAPTATGSPIVPYTGAAAANGISAAAVLASGALALFM